MSIASSKTAICPICQQSEPYHYPTCMRGKSTGIPDPAMQPAPLTEADIRRIVLDVLERVIATKRVGDNTYSDSDRKLVNAIATVRKEMGL